MPGFIALLCHLFAGAGKQVAGCTGGGAWGGGTEEQRTQQRVDSTHIRKRYTATLLHPPRSHAPSLWTGLLSHKAPYRVTSTARASLFPTLAPWPHAAGASPCPVPLPICLPALVSLEQLQGQP